MERGKINAETGKGSATNCPAGCGMTRYITTSPNVCCNICNKIPGRNKCVGIGEPMWGCRACDWDVCEEKCYEPAMEAKRRKAVADKVRMAKGEKEPPGELGA